MTPATGALRMASAATATGLVARRFPLPGGPAFDPWDLAGDDGRVLAEGGRVLVGVGTALTVDLPGGLADPDGVADVVATLATVACDDLLGPDASPLRPVLALGALPFLRDAPGSLAVPAVLYCREPDGTEWATVTGPTGEVADTDPGRLRAALATRAAGVARRDPGGWRLDDRSTGAEFEARVARAVDAIGRHELDKVVLARRVDVTADGPPGVPAILRRWSVLEPSCTLFALPTPDGRFVGASPELLVERTGDRFVSRPLAGTTDRDHPATSTLPAALLESTKDAEEHRLVVQAIGDAVSPWCDELHVPDGPELVHLHSITHLGTTLEGRLAPRADGTVPHALDLVALLHPTPAVGGAPRDAALRLIARLEDGPRGNYAGPVGWIDGAGDGRFVVGIRAMTVAGTTVVLTAGVGVVSGSRPAVELRETELKFGAVFDALAPGVPFATAPGTPHRA